MSVNAKIIPLVSVNTQLPLPANVSLAFTQHLFAPSYFHFFFVCAFVYAHAFMCRYTYMLIPMKARG